MRSAFVLVAFSTRLCYWYFQNRVMKKVFIKTYGCQMNERDSEAVAAMLRGRGYDIVRSEGDADVILLNTCSVRDFAE